LAYLGCYCRSNDNIIAFGKKYVAAAKEEQFIFVNKRGFYVS
jgi:hypothetical protein